ncbi:hypothetical protein [Streptomyces sp. 7N604]|uniref:hypothetical protein n=1 Tax=Streptomyces sp. 7N604 TaxID=3457415 RepID=UPI003FCF1CAA
MRTPARRGVVAALVAAATAALTVLGTAPAQAALPTPVSAATARSYLASMPATSEHSRTGYSRDFKSGKTLRTTPSPNDYILYSTTVQKNQDGVWQVVNVSTQPGRCKP